MATLVRWTNMLSSSLVLGVYLTVQNLQKPSLYLRIKPQREFNQTILVILDSAACYQHGNTCLHVAFQRTIRGHQDVETQVKLLPSDQQRVVDVQGDDVGLLAARCCYKPGGKKQEARHQQTSACDWLRAMTTSWGTHVEVRLSLDHFLIWDSLLMRKMPLP